MWETFFASLFQCAFLAIVVERSLFLIFGSDVWKAFESWIATTRAPWLDTKPFLAAIISVWIAFLLDLDMLAAAVGKSPSTPSIIVTGLFIAGGSKAVFLALKRLREFRDAKTDSEKRKLSG